jgi:hypothetical protein
MSDIVVSTEGNGSLVSSVVSLDIAADSDIGTGQIEVIVASAGGGVANLSDILDVDTSNLSASTNKYIMVYDAQTSKYKFINPDDILDASVGITTTDPTPVGMSTATINYLDDVLDNKIDLDAGEW